MPSGFGSGTPGESQIATAKAANSQMRHVLIGKGSPAFARSVNAAEPSKH
jgi:hypothetical protein